MAVLAPPLLDFTTNLAKVGEAVDAAGVLAIVVGAIYACVVFVRAWREGAPADGEYRQFRGTLGRSILLGLEFLVAGDIIRSVTAPSWQDVGILAVIVGIRTWLSFTLEVELTGKWPWDKLGGRGDAGAGRTTTE